MEDINVLKTKINNIKDFDDNKLYELHAKWHMYVKRIKKIKDENPDDSYISSEVVDFLKDLHEEIINELKARNLDYDCDYDVNDFDILTDALVYKIKKAVKSKFIIHEHKTIRQNGRPHWDLRIENNPNDDKLLSWALPKGIPDKTGVKNLAVFTEPHDKKWYSEFDKVTIPEGLYGAGDVKAVNKGYVIKWYANKYNIVFTIVDDNIGDLKRGDTYTLHRIKYQQWVIFKVKNDDKYKSRLDDIL